MLHFSTADGVGVYKIQQYILPLEIWHNTEQIGVLYLKKLQRIPDLRMFIGQICRKLSKFNTIDEI